MDVHDPMLGVAKVIGSEELVVSRWGIMEVFSFLAHCSMTLLVLMLIALCFFAIDVGLKIWRIKLMGPLFEVNSILALLEGPWLHPCKLTFSSLLYIVSCKEGVRM